MTDPFGRVATLGYDGQGRLVRITDAAGLTSEFSYAGNNFVTSLTTPYGATTFQTGVPLVDRPRVNVDRFIEATDALGQTERLEFRFQLLRPGINSNDNLGVTLYWSKDAWSPQADPEKAHILHWMQSSKVTGGVLHYQKRPLEAEVRYFYDNGCGTGTEMLDGDIGQGRRLRRLRQPPRARLANGQ